MTRLRGLAVAVLVLVVGCALVVVALIDHSAPRVVRSEKLRHDPDASYEKARDSREAIPGDSGSGPLAAAEEAYRNRAYPAEEVPFAATVAAREAFGQVTARGVGNGAGEWTLYGPSTASVPKTLSFYGGGPNAQAQVSGRTTALAIAPTCTAARCRVWVGAAGGGIWMTDKALAGSQNWRFVSEELDSNAIGSLYVDPSDPSGNTIYAGTGEPNASGDSEAGVGLYRSVDGGNSWALVGTSASVSFGRAIGSIAVDPRNGDVIYIAVARAVRGVSSVTGGATSNPPPVAAAFGVYKSIDGGETWALIWNGNNSIRGVRRIKLDPRNPDTLYASAYQQGLWRSPNGGPWEQIFVPTAPAFNTDRTEFDATVKDDGTRIYVADGAQGSPPSAVFRADHVDTTSAAALAGANNAGWTSLTSSDPTNPGYGSFNYCTGQCWYDNYIFTPPGHPDIVYLGGSHQYGELYGRSNGRGLVMSTDGGVTFTDMTVEGATPASALNLHPDHHWIAVNPSNPFMFFSATDGGVVRSNGNFRDISAQCDRRGLSPGSLVACRRLLSRVPERLVSLNQGLSTLQFQSVLADPGDHRNLVGGTQDNGTWLNNGSSENWDQTIYGDGGQSGYSSNGTGKMLFNTFTGQFTDVNFRGGAADKWVIATGPIASSPESSAFYPPVTGDPHPANPGTIFQGSQSVWRTQDWGGDQAFLEANCPEFFTSGANPACGDFVRIGPAGATNLTAAGLGDRSGGVLAAIERTVADTGTLWAATSTGRVFISKNADALDPASVVWVRLDSLAGNDPQRFVSSIYVDPTDGNHAWISYSGYNFNTAAQPGHVFEVRYDPLGGTATWTNLDGGTGPMGDLPVTDLVRDDVTGDLYAGTDFGVLMLPSGSGTWVAAGAGLPVVEVAGLTIVPESRVMYAATHGRSVWRIALP